MLFLSFIYRTCINLVLLVVVILGLGDVVVLASVVLYLLNFDKNECISASKVLIDESFEVIYGLLLSYRRLSLCESVLGYVGHCHPNAAKF